VAKDLRTCDPAGSFQEGRQPPKELFFSSGLLLSEAVKSQQGVGSIFFNKTGFNPSILQGRHRPVFGGRG